MTLSQFSAAERQKLKFGVIDVFMFVAHADLADAGGGLNEAENTALMDMLEHTEFTKSLLLREVLDSIATGFAPLFDAYSPQYRLSPSYFSKSLGEVRDILDEKLGAAGAREFKGELCFHFGGIIASVAYTDSQVGATDLELTAIAEIARWLGIGPPD